MDILEDSALLAAYGKWDELCNARDRLVAQYVRHASPEEVRRMAAYFIGDERGETVPRQIRVVQEQIAAERSKK